MRIYYFSTDTVRTKARLSMPLYIRLYCLGPDHSAVSGLTEYTKMWLTSEEGRLLQLTEMVLQWVRVAQATLHLEGQQELKRREEERRARKEIQITRQQRRQWVRQWLLRRPMYGKKKKGTKKKTASKDRSRRTKQRERKEGRRKRCNYRIDSWPQKD